MTPTDDEFGIAAQLRRCEVDLLLATALDPEDAVMMELLAGRCDTMRQLQKLERAWRALTSEGRDRGIPD
jgi:hypothetical protein